MTFDPEYADFEDVRVRPADELRSLLHRGDPIERAWAGWALALQIGAEANPELAAEAHVSPTPGVRTLLLVVLAGHGERELLYTFAEADPDDEVRAAACRYVAMNWPAHDEGAGEFLAARLRDDTSSRVRAEVLRLVRGDRIGVPRALVEASAADRDLDVRTLAAEILLAADIAGGRFPSALEPRATVEPDGDLRRRLVQAWIDTGGARRLLEDLAREASADLARTLEILRAIVAAGETFDWDALAPFRDREEPTLDAEVARLLDRVDDAAALSWLLRVSTLPLDYLPKVANRATSTRSGELYEAACAAMPRLAEACRHVNPSLLSPQDRSRLRRLADHLEEQVAVALEMELGDEGVDVASLPTAEQPPWYKEDVALIERFRRVAIGS